MPAGHLRPGEPVRTLDGRTATVVAARVVPGEAPMWDLTVSQVHTFAVGDGRFVVHNCSKHIDDPFDDEPQPQKAGRPKEDRLRGGDSKRAADDQVKKMAGHLNMTDDEAYGFKDYVEGAKEDVGSGNDYNFSWKDLKRLGQRYIREVRREDW